MSCGALLGVSLEPLIPNQMPQINKKSPRFEVINRSKMEEKLRNYLLIRHKAAILGYLTKILILNLVQKKLSVNC